MNKFLKLVEKSNRLQILLSLILIVSLSYFALKPLLAPGFFPVHDNTQIQRVHEMEQSLADGMLPVRWVKDLGYGFGYPIFNFYAPLPYYLGGSLNFVGLNALIATKLMFFAGILASGIFMYFLTRKLIGDLGGILSAVVYTYAPYHAVNIFARGDVGEIWAYAFIPLVFYFIYKLYKTSSWIFVSALGISYSAVILSHNLTAFMLTPFLIIAFSLILFESFKKKNFRSPALVLYGLALGILISSFYSLPALLELKYTNVDSIISGGSNFRDHFVCAQQLWSSQWGFGGSGPGCLDGISFKIGKIALIATLLSSLALFVSLKAKKKNETALIGVVTLLGFLISVFLTLQVSKPVWEAVDPMRYIQFPWRFLAFVSFFSSILVGYLVFFTRERFNNKRIIEFCVFAILAGGLFFTNIKLFIPQRIIDHPSSYYTSSEVIKWETSKISDEYMPPDFPRPKSQDQVAGKLAEIKEGELKVITDKTKDKEIVLFAPEKVKLVLNMAYFPAWRALIDYKEIPVFSSTGRVGVEIPQGYHLLNLKFRETYFERVGNFLSLIGIAAALAVIILEVTKKNEKKA